MFRSALAIFRYYSKRNKVAELFLILSCDFYILGFNNKVPLFRYNNNKENLNDRT